MHKRASEEPHHPRCSVHFTLLEGAFAHGEVAIYFSSA
jgi:hypothetical protein